MTTSDPPKKARDFMTDAVHRSPSWAAFVAAHAALVAARMAVHRDAAQVVDDVTRSLAHPGRERSAAIAYLESLESTSLEPYVDALASLALAVHGHTENVWQLLSNAPRGAVVLALDAIEASASERALYEEFACLIELWQRLALPERATKLASEACESRDEAVRDVGESYLAAQAEDPGEASR